MKIALVLLIAIFSGCANPGGPDARWYYGSGERTAPGHELPAFIDHCKAQDIYGRCTKWSVGSGEFRP